MSRVEVVVSGSLPNGLQVGDEFPVIATARVIAVAEELVDITSYGQTPGSETLPGERTVRLLLTLRGAEAARPSTAPIDPSNHHP